ncbi:MAG: trypsin-like peptidase domain-containing protein [Thermodesulfobacteriota bacterium]|nr:trypsin-like peptidase domain-containing protein [Thermodesulfobacteriota bacterium]
MKIIIRYLGMSIIQKDLKPGEYTIGRAKGNDIQISHDFISRTHAKIFFADGQWWYQDLRVGHIHYKIDPISITNESKIEIENQVELVTEDYVDYSETVLYETADISAGRKERKKSHRPLIAMVTTIILLLIAGGAIYYYTISERPMDANTLFKFVRPKIVEFIKVKDPKAIRDLKKYAGVDDKDFKDEIGYCTGFIVGPGIVLTANHCLHGLALVDSDIKFKLKTHDGKLHQVERVLGFDIKRDFLYLQAPSLKEYGYLEISPKEAKVGEKVYTIGNVAGEGIAIRDGIMASKTKDPDDPEVEFIRYSAAASPGNSGGPLVDEYGKVTALVFASTMAENYNLGTGSENLLQGRDRFVDNLDTKKVKIETRNLLNYHPNNLAYLLYLPISNTWFENPDLILPLKNIVAQVDVPAGLPDHYEALISKFNTATLDKFQEVQAKIKEDGLVTEDWASQVTEATPVIIPYQTNIDALYYRPEEGHQLIIEKMAILTPMKSYGYNKFKKKLKTKNRYSYKANAQVLTLNTDLELGDPTCSVLYRSGSSNSKERLERFSRRPVSQYLGTHKADDANWKAARQASARTVMKVLARKGLLCSSYDSYYLRPNAKREFKIKNFEEEIVESSFKDILGRSWNVFSFKLFGNTTVDNYCIMLPQGTLCLSVPYYTVSDVLLSVLRENYSKYVLSSILVAPNYWSVDALQDYYQKGLAENLPLMKDVGFEKQKNGGMMITFKTLGIEFSIPESELPQSLRFTAGMYYNGGDKKWIALGFEGIYPDKKKWKIKGVGVEPKGSNASGILSRIRDELKSKKELTDKLGKGNLAKREKNALIWREDIKTKRGGIEVVLFGYSAPIIKHGESDRLMNIDFYSRKPFKITYQLLEGR